MTAPAIRRGAPLTNGDDMHLKKIAEQVAERTGADKSTAYVAARVALEATPPPAGTRWDYYAVPDERVDDIIERAAAAVNEVGGDPLAAVQPLVAAQEDYADTLEASERARETRDDAMRSARAAGVPIAELQRVTGLSRARVSAICAQ